MILFARSVTAPAARWERWRRPPSLAVALLAALLALAVQAATVYANYGGNWSALFRHGGDYPLPSPVRAEHVYSFPAGTGYDGQIYHFIAHDPLFRRGFAPLVDDPSIRYRRILVPGLAWAIALGSDAAVDVAYRLVILVFVALSAFWLGRWATAHGRGAWWGLGVLLVPAVWISVERMTIDVALAALTIAFALYGRAGVGLAPEGKRADVRLLIVLALAGLSRETGVLLPAAYVIFLVLSRAWRVAVWAGLATVPAMAWFLFVEAHTTPKPYPHRFVPLSGIVSAWVAPAPAAEAGAGSAVAPVSPWKGIVPFLERSSERMGLAGILLAIGFSVASLRRGIPGPDRIAALLFALLAVIVQRTDHWRHVYDYGRVCSPLLVLLAMQAMAQRRIVPLVPTVLMWPRLLLQVRTQLAGIARALIS